ncbi:hypothetical protein [Pedobacter duraquae]|uniref:Uncharacterized protein n=1 Tax=Pedobacter duraquae TaxID=425511 RepID=A0A4V6PSF7_9SPHI|nr:hypothetical protein [Pedobacter duraquae]TDO23828.1 hypothetical protein CLV32_0113 [Pedobacter duraquae]
MEHEQKKQESNRWDEQNHTSLPSDGPVSESEGKGTSDLQNTEKTDDPEEISGDLAGNASGNEDADEQ